MKLCMGCMNKMDDSRWNCPNCGFDEKSYRPDPVCIPIGTVIGGKYIVGKCLKKTNDTILYIGWDAEQEKKLEIEEFFPMSYSYRDPGETEIGAYAGDAEELFEKRLNEFLNAGSLTLKDNNTGYRLKERVDEKPSESKDSHGKRKVIIASLVGAVLIAGVMSWFLFLRKNSTEEILPSANPTATVTPTETVTASPTPTEDATATPEPTETVTESPTPTEEATAAPEPVKEKKKSNEDATAKPKKEKSVTTKKKNAVGGTEK